MVLKAAHVWGLAVVLVGVGAAAALKFTSHDEAKAVFDPEASFREAAGRFEAALRKQMPENPAAQFSFKFSAPMHPKTFKATDRLDKPDELRGSYGQLIWMVAKLNKQDSEALLGIPDLTLAYDCTFTFKFVDGKWKLAEAMMNRKTMGLPTTDPRVLAQYEMVGDMLKESNGGVGGRVQRARDAAGL